MTTDLNGHYIARIGGEEIARFAPGVHWEDYLRFMSMVPDFSTEFVSSED